jgi:CelD/BcsL family acetyltransferase involved in cellulose biosynthesis
MERCLEQGLRRYDFMASDLRYKQSLSNGRRELVWAVLSPPRISLYVEDLLRRGAARARGLRDYLMSPARAALRRHASVS